MSSKPTVVYSAANTQQAYLLRGLLEEEGITARVVNDALQLAGGELPLGWAAAARVVVPERDAARARQIAADFDRQTSSASQSREPANIAAPESWSDWPVCPQCGMRRSAECPICGSVGADFPLADYQPTVSGDRVLLMCRTCDDHMVPKWYRFCAGCDHDFGSGIEPTAAQIRPLEFSRASLLVLAILTTMALIFLLYFWWLLG